MTQPAPDGAGSAAASVTRYAYDAAGNQLTLTDPTLNVTTWTYDRKNHQLTDTNQLRRSRSVVYDANGNLIPETDHNGRVMTLTYDNLNRFLQENYSGNSINFGSIVNDLITLTPQDSPAATTR